MTEQIMSHTSPPVGSDITVEPLHEITLSVNGAPHTATAPARRLLSDFLPVRSASPAPTSAASTASAVRAQSWSTAHRCARA